MAFTPSLFRIVCAIVALMGLHFAPSVLCRNNADALATADNAAATSRALTWYGAHVCGYRGKRCCSHHTCKRGLKCSHGKCRPRPPPCGGKHQRCCTHGHGCKSGSLKCKRGNCVPCGKRGQPCCSSGRRCPDGRLTCKHGKCATKPKPGPAPTDPPPPPAPGGSLVARDGRALAERFIQISAGLARSTTFTTACDAPPLFDTAGNDACLTQCAGNSCQKSCGEISNRDSSYIRATQTASGVTLVVELFASDFCRAGNLPYYTGCANEMIPASGFSLSADLWQGSLQAEVTLKACIGARDDRSDLTTSGTIDPNFVLGNNPFDGVKVVIDVSGTCGNAYDDLQNSVFGDANGNLEERRVCDNISPVSAVITIDGVAAEGVGNSLYFADVYAERQLP